MLVLLCWWWWWFILLDLFCVRHDKSLALKSIYLWMIGLKQRVRVWPWVWRRMRKNHRSWLPWANCFMARSRLWKKGKREKEACRAQCLDKNKGRRLSWSFPCTPTICPAPEPPSPSKRSVRPNWEPKFAAFICLPPCFVCLTMTPMNCGHHKSSPKSNSETIVVIFNLAI